MKEFAVQLTIEAQISLRKGIRLLQSIDILTFLPVIHESHCINTGGSIKES